MIGRTQHFMLFGSKNYHQNISINASTPFYQFFLIDINTDYNIISTITSTFNTNDQIPPSHPHISILGERALLLQTAFTLQEFNLLQRMEKMNAILSAEIDELAGHLKAHHKDHSSRRGLLRKVGERRRLLKYLQRENAASYEELVKKLKLKQAKQFLKKDEAKDEKKDEKNTTTTK